MTRDTPWRRALVWVQCACLVLAWVFPFPCVADDALPEAGLSDEIVVDVGGAGGGVTFENQFGDTLAAKTNPTGYALALGMRVVSETAQDIVEGQALDESAIETVSEIVNPVFLAGMAASTAGLIAASLIPVPGLNGIAGHFIAKLPLVIGAYIGASLGTRATAQAVEGKNVDLGQILREIDWVELILRGAFASIGSVLGSFGGPLGTIAGGMIGNLAGSFLYNLVKKHLTKEFAPKAKTTLVARDVGSNADERKGGSGFTAARARNTLFGKAY